MAKAKFVIEGEVQKVGFRANLISFASEAYVYYVRLKTSPTIQVRFLYY